MTATEHYQKQVVTLPDTSSVVDVAAAMERDAVGCVVIASERDAGSTAASAIMSHPAITAETNDELETVIERMSRHGVRRIPIGKGGGVVGIVALDDLLALLGRELDALRERVRQTLQ